MFAHIECVFVVPSLPPPTCAVAEIFLFLLQYSDSLNDDFDGLPLFSNNHRCYIQMFVLSQIYNLFRKSDLLGLPFSDISFILF